MLTDQFCFSVLLFVTDLKGIFYLLRSQNSELDKECDKECESKSTLIADGKFCFIKKFFIVLDCIRFS